MKEGSMPNMYARVMTAVLAGVLVIGVPGFVQAEPDKDKIRGEADLKLAEVDVQTLAHDEKADMAAIEAAVRKSEAAHSNLRIEGIKTVRAAFAVLTPEQKEKMRSSRSMRHEGGKGKGDYDKGAPDGKPEPKGGMR